MVPLRTSRESARSTADRNPKPKQSRVVNTSPSGILKMNLRIKLIADMAYLLSGFTSCLEYCLYFGQRTNQEKGSMPPKNLRQALLTCLFSFLRSTCKTKKNRTFGTGETGYMQAQKF